MEVLEQGKLKITGAECLGAVEEAQLQQALGRHGVLRATVWLLPDQDSGGENGNWKGLPISLTAVGREEEPIFCGLVKHVCFRKIKGRPAVQLTAYSYTVQLDAEKRDRSYQQESRTCGELVEMLLAPCGGVYIWSRPGKDMPVGRFLMQYKETDWQFLCRVASLQGYPVVPEVRLPGARLYIGLPEGRKAQPLEADTWRVRKTLAKPSQTVDNGDSGTLSGGTEILVEDCYEDYLLGDVVAFQGSSLFIAGKDSRLRGNQWVHTYTLRTEEDCHKGKIDNPYMAGAAVKGTVLETTLTSSRLLLTTDAEGEQPESLHLQPVYYAGDGKGYSGQPEKGDTQYLYFPTMREEERYIIGCADAGTKQIDALLETIESEASEEEASEAAAGGDTVGSAVVAAGTIPLSAPLTALSGAGGAPPVRIHSRIRGRTQRHGAPPGNGVWCWERGESSWPMPEKAGSAC